MTDRSHGSDGRNGSGLHCDLDELSDGRDGIDGIRDAERSGLHGGSTRPREF